MTIFSQIPTIAELCNLMANHRAGITVRHVATEHFFSGITYHDFVTSDGRHVVVVIDHARQAVTMQMDGQGWSDIGAVR